MRTRSWKERSSTSVAELNYQYYPPNYINIIWGNLLYSSPGKAGGLPRIFIKYIIVKITSPKEFSDVKLKLIALLCMLLAVTLTFPRYGYQIEYFKWIWCGKRTKTVEIILRPDVLSLLCAIFITLPVYLINKNYIKISLYNIIIGLLDIMIIASAFSLFFGTAEWTIPLIGITIGTRQFVLAAIFLTWICMKSVAIPIWGASFILAAVRLSDVNN